MFSGYAVVHVCLRTFEVKITCRSAFRQVSINLNHLDNVIGPETPFHLFEIGIINWDLTQLHYYFASGWNC